MTNRFSLSLRTDRGCWETVLESKSYPALLSALRLHSHPWGRKEKRCHQGRCPPGLMSASEHCYPKAIVTLDQLALRNGFGQKRGHADLTHSLGPVHTPRVCSEATGMRGGYRWGQKSGPRQGWWQDSQGGGHILRVGVGDTQGRGRGLYGGISRLTPVPDDTSP